jgi:glycopeptide antibiotics resistance protein
LRSHDGQAARLARACLVLWFVGLLAVTLGGCPQDAYGRIDFNWMPFATESTGHGTEIILNLLLFVPAGLLLIWVARHASDVRLVLTASTGAAFLSSLMECVQTFTPLCTAGDITDILLNTTGCVLAAILGVGVRHTLAHERRQKPRRTERSSQR